MVAARERHGGGLCGRGRGVRGRLARLAAARLRSRALPGAELSLGLGAAGVPRRVPRLPVPRRSRQVRQTLLSRRPDLAPWSRYETIRSSCLHSSQSIISRPLLFLPALSFYLSIYLQIHLMCLSHAYFIFLIIFTSSYIYDLLALINLDLHLKVNISLFT